MLTAKAPARPTLHVHHIAAFSHGGDGGNPAGVVICDHLPDASEMQAMAAQVGYSETVFAAPVDEGWRVRYFAPAVEVPFCGHATIALGAALAWEWGDGQFPLLLNDGPISVEGNRQGDTVTATLTAPPTGSEAAPATLVDDALALFGYTAGDLDPALPPAIARAGGRFLVLPLADRARLAAMRYELESGRRLMREAGVITITLVHARTRQLFHVRNPFASGGVYEDPATGAAAAAFAGYLRERGWPHGGAIDILQGEDMGMPSHLRVEIPQAPAAIRVSGEARYLF